MLMMKIDSLIDEFEVMFFMLIRIEMMAGEAGDDNIYTLISIEFWMLAQ